MASNHLLRAAAQAGDLAKVHARLDAGDETELRHKGTGRTPLLEAVIAGNPDVVALLLDKGAAVEVSCTAVGHTSLAWAVVQQHPDIVRLLLARGIDIDAVAENSFLRRTPLHLAAQVGNAAIVEMLVEAGADIDRVDGRGENALSLARAGCHTDAIAILETAGAGEPPQIPPLVPLPWPDLDWDPEHLAHINELPDAVEPAQLVASYIRALHAWELAVWQRSNDAKVQGNWFDLGPSLEAAEHLTALHTTDKVRKYRRASIGPIPDLTPDFVLVDVVESLPSRRKLLLQHPEPIKFMHEYEWIFDCLRRNGRWRINAARKRLRGTREWRSAVL